MLTVASRIPRTTPRSIKPRSSCGYVPPLLDCPLLLAYDHEIVATRWSTPTLSVVRLQESKLVKYMTDITKEVRRRLETAASPDSIFAMRLTESIHRAGINVRHLGRLYSLIIADPPSEFRHTCCAIVMVEMISRVLKRVRRCGFSQGHRDDQYTLRDMSGSCVGDFVGPEAPNAGADVTHQDASRAAVLAAGSCLACLRSLSLSLSHTTLTP